MGMMALDYRKPDRGWCGDPSRGAAMGRSSDLPEDTTAALHIRRVPLDGDYDPGGTYWGGGPGTLPLYLAWDDEDHVRYLRAASLDEARKAFPRASWAPETGPTEDDVSDALDAYVEAMLGTATDESDENGGDPLDEHYSSVDVHPDSLAKMRTVVETFLRDNAASILPCIGKRGPYGKHEVDWSLVGYHLWMTQQGTGVCFLDGDYPEPHAHALADAADELDEMNAYVGDDGHVYVD